MQHSHALLPCVSLTVMTTAQVVWARTLMHTACNTRYQYSCQLAPKGALMCRHCTMSGVNGAPAANKGGRSATSTHLEATLVKGQRLTVKGSQAS